MACSARSRYKVTIPELEAIKSTKSLGVIGDQLLSMENQISGIIRTCMYSTGYGKKAIPNSWCDQDPSAVLCHKQDRLLQRSVGFTTMNPSVTPLESHEYCREAYFPKKTKGIQHKWTINEASNSQPGTASKIIAKSWSLRSEILHNIWWSHLSPFRASDLELNTYYHSKAVIAAFVQTETKNSFFSENRTVKEGC